MADIKKAIVLAGGLGLRLRPLTYEIPKPLIPVQGKTLTEHVFELLKEWGIKEVVLSLSYQHQKIQNYFKDGKDFGLKISYAIEDEPLGTAGPLLMLPKIKETFVVVNGDNLFDLDFKQFVKTHRKNKAVATLAITKVEDPTQYGTVVMKKDKIVKFLEKTSTPPTNTINSGYYLMEPKIFDYLKGKDKAMFETDIFPVLAKEGKLYGYIDTGQWFDTGTFDRWERVIKEWRNI